MARASKPHVVAGLTPSAFRARSRASRASFRGF